MISVALHAQEKIIAFPGADGYGKYTTGGRGGKVVIVSNLNDHGPGSLREALSMKGPRIIVFSVAGNIELESDLEIKNGDVTVAGQSAPGGGICIKNYPVEIVADNVIIRFMRFRLGDEKAQQADSFGGTKGKQNILIDHCSISWATDECASFYRNKNFTMQWCIISESLNKSVHEKGEHGYGGIWGGERASFHHNLLASHNSRMPRFSGSSTTPNSPDELVDFRNNVIYNWASNNTYGGEKGRYNVVNNYYKPGPATKSKRLWFINPSAPYGKFYISGNCLDGHLDVTGNNIKGVKADYPDSAIVNKPFDVEAIHEQSAKKAYELVLKSAGASLRRDAVDLRVVSEVRSASSSLGKNKNGIIDSQNDVGGWPLLAAVNDERDSDADGIPDNWERRNKLDLKNPKDASERTLNKNYDNIEVYLNALVDKVIVK
ncbi:pectate lyase [Fulvivirgaceae bacterium PWU20]|uniref:Pectate lyase n=1 Tax=Chryseosolibacter indicus TaxID=2782351 RepID=A0ABS5VR53_9BACT|nr:pectate lyase [Chryseosolibacter indicus]